MTGVRAEAERLGVRVALEDLGDWGPATCIAEYDPSVPAIRVNARALERYRAQRGELSSCDVRTFVEYAIAHELFHHRERIGAEPRRATRPEREAAADAYARAYVALDPPLAAFLGERGA